MGRMTDEDLGRLLRELPRPEASSDFSSRVLAKLDSGSRRGRKSRSRTAVLALAAVGIAGFVLTRDYARERFERSQAAERVRELRDEYRELQTELDKLRVLTRELEPVLDLGGTDDVEFVFDLRELARPEIEDSEKNRATPASHSPSHQEEGEP